jgi:hypothetical protein
MFKVEASTAGLIFLLLVFGFGTLALPALAFRYARERSPWFLFACGFFLFCLMVDVLCVTQLLDIKFPHRDHFLTGLLVVGFGLCLAVWPLMVFGQPFRRVTKSGFALLAALLLLAVASGTVRVLDSILLWMAGGEFPGPVASAVSLGSWERAAFGFLAGASLLVFSLVLATASTESIYEKSKNGTITGRFGGSSPGVRKLSKAVATVACLAASLYGFSVFSDATFGTSFKSWFQPLVRALDTLEAIGNAWDFYTEWAGFLIVAGLFIWYAVSEEQWGYLTAILLGLTVYFTWAISAGLFDDWGGPVRGAWNEVASWFR